MTKKEKREVRTTIYRIAHKFDQIENLFNTIPEPVRDSLWSFLAEDKTIQHCYRWGLTGCAEILDNFDNATKEAE